MTGEGRNEPPRDPGRSEGILLQSCGKRASRIGLGCWQLGGRGWGSSDAKQLRRTVGEALERGVRLFDTAPIYGLGRSEELLGELLAGSPAGAEAVVISKGGLVWDASGRVRHDNRPASLRRQLEETLSRLGRDTLDVYLLHWPDPATPLAESVGALEGFRAEGSIRGWGLSNHRGEDLARLAAGPAGVRTPLLELALNVLEEGDQRDLLPIARRAGWDTVAFDVLARGILGGRYAPVTRFGRKDVRRGDPRFASGAFARNLERAEQLRAIAARHGVTPAAIAIAVVCAIPGVSACVVGMKDARQLAENLAAESVELDDEERARLWPAQ